MKYIKTYQLFEAATRQSVTDEIVKALENTVEGKDLLSLAYSSTSGDLYKPRRTGRVEINYLRGKTYITQLENGKWYHAVEATGRTYGEGIYDSLTECIRGVWIDFITNSTSIRPKGMPLKMYKKFVDQEINNMMGKNLSILEIRSHLSKSYFDGKTPMDWKSPIFSSPRWIQILDFIGFKRTAESPRWDSRSKIIINYIQDDIKSPKSILRTLAEIMVPTGGTVLKSLYSEHFVGNIEIIFYEYPKKLELSYSSIQIGDTIEKYKEIETIAAKRFVDHYSEIGGYLIRNNSDADIFVLKMLVGFVMNLVSIGMEGEDEIEINDDLFFQSMAQRMKDLNIPAEVLVKIRKKLPELWNIYKDLGGKDPGGLETMADLGELGF